MRGIFHVAAMLDKLTTALHRPGTWLDPSSMTEIPHAELLRRMRAKQAVLLGETHDRFDVHRWQLHVLAGLHALDPNIAVGFEMFPRRVQGALDRFVAGQTSVDEFLTESEWDTVWRFDPALYLPIFHFCRQFKVPMKALNCRRALVTEVGKLGWDAIPEADRDGLTPSKPASKAYRDYLFAVTGGVREGREAQSGSDPAFDRFVRAQQTWDRAFACGIADARRADNPPLVVGIIGRGHLEYYGGTPFQLADLGIPDVGVLLPADDDIEPSHTGIADAVFRLDTVDRSTMPRKVAAG